MYTDDTILTWGKHKITKLCRVPADYLLRLYNNNNHPDKELIKYIGDNMEKIIARKEGKLESPPLDLDFKFAGKRVEVVCPDTGKIIFFSEKEAKKELGRIKNTKHEHKKPIRTYECIKCGGWHLTSLSNEQYEIEFHGG